MDSPLNLSTFNKLYNDYWNRFLKFAYSYVRDHSISEDIVSESFTSCWEHRSDFTHETNIPAYLFTTVKNKCLSHLNRAEIKARILSSMQKNAEWELETRISSLEACDPQELFSTEVQTIIKKTLASLSPRTLEVFSMSRYQNKSHKEIAQILGITNKGVEFHIAKALSKLRKNLKDYLLQLILIFYM